MNPNNFGKIEDNINLPKILAICHRGTQTKKNSPKDSIHSTRSKGICTDGCGGSSDEGSVKLFEFSQIIQDTDHPGNITIIKDTFSEEIHEHSSTSKEAAANRYKYSREVIQPFLKDYSVCDPLSDEEVIKEVLESVQKDFPDYQPCFGTNGCSGIESFDCDNKLEKPIKSLKKKTDESPSFLCCEKLNSGAQPANASSSGTVFIPVKACEKPEVKQKVKDKTDSSSSVTSCSGKSGDITGDICNMDKDAKNKSSSSKPLAEDEYDDPYDPCKKPKCPRKSICPEGIKPCKKPRNEPKVPPAPFCAKNSGPPCYRNLTTGCEDENDLKEKAKRAKQACHGGSGSSIDLPPVTKPPPQKSVMQAHCEAIDTLKAVASTAMCKVYEVTKDTVTLIRTESAKQLEKIKAFGSECENACDSSPKNPAKKKGSNTGVTEVTNILGTKNIMENLGQLQKVDPEDILQKMAEKIESTVSIISDNLIGVDRSSHERPRTPPRDFIHNISKEDVHAAEGPHEVKQDFSNTANNMFTAIKSKIFSMFSDINKGVENPEICEDDDDDDN